MVKALSPRRALLDLARSYGVQVTYQDVARQRRTAVSESLLAVLQALGAPVAGVKDAPAAYEERLLQQGRRVLPPTAVRWEGRGKPVPLRLPQGLSGAVRCTLLLESGEERRWDLTVGGTDGSVSLPGPLPFGYHRLQVEGGGQQGECLVIAAPERAYAPPQERAWGVFLPLYALHSRESWGAGDMGDLEALVRWTGVQGGSLVGVLPLLAAFLDAPYDPSPYAPASRLFWNEFYLDVRRLPELGQCSQARAMLESGAFQEETAALRSQPLVDYPRQMVLKRSVLQALAASLFAEESPRSQALWAYVKAHAELDTYARFRAALEQQGRPWRSWPVHLRTGRLKEGDYREEARRYHLYVQWAMEQQMEAVADAGRRCGMGLYLDLPLGVHPQGYDTWRWQDLFLEGVSIGAPPDALGPEGQVWGIPPLHPERLQDQGFAYLIACLRRHMAHAGALRVDHVMGLRRQFWAPRGMKAGQGVYVRYPQEALYAILALESNRHQVMVVGEDLGTVPSEVRPAMERHGLHRMYVAQFEMAHDPSQALRPVPEGAVASLNTHDTPTFAGFLQGQDLELRLEMATLDAASAEEGLASRQALAPALAAYLQGKGLLAGGDISQEGLCAGVVRALGESPASLVLVNLEDLCAETQPQNVPGTASRYPNWRRRARYSLEEFTRMPGVLSALQDLADARPRRGPSSEPDGPVPVAFSLYAPEARSVSLLGDFNGWDTQANPMLRRAGGLWEVLVALGPGSYQYKFLVDGIHWLEDPSNPLHLPNPYGGYNSLREVMAPNG